MFQDDLEKRQWHGNRTWLLGKAAASHWHPPEYRLQYIICNQHLIMDSVYLIGCCSLRCTSIEDQLMKVKREDLPDLNFPIHLLYVYFLFLVCFLFILLYLYFKAFTVFYTVTFRYVTFYSFQHFNFLLVLQLLSTHG